MKKIMFVLLIACCGTILSCSKDDTEGDWDDNIQLSEKLVVVSAEESVTSISTVSDSWWLTFIYLDDNEIDLHGIHPTAPNFIVENREFTVERKNGTEIIIHMQANTTTEDRAVVIGLQNGNYFDMVRVIQKAP